MANIGSSTDAFSFVLELEDTTGNSIGRRFGRSTSVAVKNKDAASNSFIYVGGAFEKNHVDKRAASTNTVADFAPAIFRLKGDDGFLLEAYTLEFDSSSSSLENDYATVDHLKIDGGSLFGTTRSITEGAPGTRIYFFRISINPGQGMI